MSASSRVVRFPKRDRRRAQLDQALSQPLVYGGYAVRFPECCRRIGMSVRKGEHLRRMKRFPIPSLERIGTEHLRYSSVEIDLYLNRSSIAAVLPASRGGRRG